MEPSPDVAWYHKPFWIAVLALFVLGPMALPLVWRSPALGKTARWVWTILILLYTVLLFWETWVAVQLALQQIQLQNP